MRHKLTKEFFQLSAGLAFFAALLLGAPGVNAQEQQAPSAMEPQVAGNVAPAVVAKEKAPAALMPVFSNYKGVTIGMSADEVRQTLDHLKEKGKKQDFFVFSDHESAQVYYDDKGMVRVISVDYIGKDSNAPDAMTVLGEELSAKANGAMYKLIRYPMVKYWVSYSRTAGDSPIVTITMQKMR